MRYLLGASGAASVLAALFMPNFPAAPAKADSQQTQCYSLPNVVPYSDEITATTSVWCYRGLDDGSRIVFAPGRRGKPKPELTIVISKDGIAEHSSLNAGRLTRHRFKASGWNPFGIPLDPPADGVRVPLPTGPMTAETDDGIDAVLRTIGGAPPAEGEDLPFSAVVEVGSFRSKATYMPWRSYWYPHRARSLYKEAASPMEKYDRFVARRIGMSPRAAEWERKVHPPRAVGWAGHCNGWSAASIMRPEPTKPITDPFTGITFTVADQKGLWLEADYCAKSAYFGYRNFGDGIDGDIRAADFHNAIVYYLGVLKKPLVMDLMANAPVENRVVSGFSMNVTRTGARVFRVETQLTIHAYDKKPNDEVGPAGVFRRTYRYLLEVDEEGKPIVGQWLSYHPDFLWVPLAYEECESKNPVVHEAWLTEIQRLAERPSNPLQPAEDQWPPEIQPEYQDPRPPGAAPVSDPEATPPPAESQPDEGVRT